MKSIAANLRNNFLSLAALAAAIGLTVYILRFVPMEKEIQSLGEFFLKLTPFVFAAICIASMNFKSLPITPIALLMIPLMFLGFFCYFVPKLFYFSNEFEQMYQTMLMAVPYLILVLVFCYRLGGGTPEMCLRLAFAMLLLMLSGIEDLAYLLLSSRYDPDWRGIPEVWEWASHMTIFLGRPLVKLEAYAFILIHIVLALLVLFLPRGRARASK